MRRRDYQNASIEELEELGREDPRGVLGELEHRRTRRAGRLRERLAGDLEAMAVDGLEQLEEPDDVSDWAVSAGWMPDDEAMPDDGVGFRILREMDVVVRVPWDCADCGESIPAGQTSARKVYILAGELCQEDRCASCADPSVGESVGTCGDERWRKELHDGSR